MVAERFSTALTVIARNEAPRIGRLLESMKRWVDQIFLLDTGSTDETISIAIACGARVCQQPWQDDFAAARNAVFDFANADWHVVLDADEWIESGGHVFQKLRETPPEFVGMIRLIDHFGDGTASSWLSRVFPGSLRYRGKVHEQVKHNLPVRRLDVVVGHDGYSPERLKSKRGRNHRLLTESLVIEPRDAYLWYQLGKNHDVYDEHREAEAAFDKATSLLPSQAPAWLTDLVVRRLRTLCKLGRHEDALHLAVLHQRELGESPDYHFAVGNLLLDLGASSESPSPEVVSLMEQSWRRCLELGERPEQAFTVTGRGSWMAAHNLALLLEGTGRASEAQSMRESVSFPNALASVTDGSRGVQRA